MLRKLLHRAIACQARHIQRRHPSVARRSHDTGHELLADAAATPARLNAECRFRRRALIPTQPELARTSQFVIREIAENCPRHGKAKLRIFVKLSDTPMAKRSCRPSTSRRKRWLQKSS